jgi:hypothetical protein
MDTIEDLCVTDGCVDQSPGTDCCTLLTVWNYASCDDSVSEFISLDSCTPETTETSFDTWEQDLCVADVEVVEASLGLSGVSASDFDDQDALDALVGGLATVFGVDTALLTITSIMDVTNKAVSVSVEYEIFVDSSTDISAGSDETALGNQLTTSLAGTGLSPTVESASAESIPLATDESLQVCEITYSDTDCSTPVQYNCYGNMNMTCPAVLLANKEGYLQQCNQLTDFDTCCDGGSFGMMVTCSDQFLPTASPSTSASTTSSMSVTPSVTSSPSFSRAQSPSPSVSTSAAVSPSASASQEEEAPTSGGPTLPGSLIVAGVLAVLAARS